MELKKKSGCWKRFLEMTNNTSPFTGVLSGKMKASVLTNLEKDTDQTWPVWSGNETISISVTD